MKRLFAIILITIGHATVTLILFLRHFGMGMSRFEAPTPITSQERVLGGIVEVLMWPVFAPLTHWGGKWANNLFPGLLGYIPFLLNSLVWALVVVWFWRKIRGETPTMLTCSVSD